MAKDSVRLRETTPAERWSDAAWLLCGGAYSIAFWSAHVFYVWRALFG